MAVMLCETVNTYTGLAVDVKPTAAAVGSTFEETDTGSVFRWNGTAWIVTSIRGSTLPVQVTLTRPADVNAYAANDAISDSTAAPTLLTFANAARINGGGGYITNLRLRTNQSTNVALYRLYLFRGTPAAINDNSPYTLLWANRAICLGYIDVGPLATEGAGSDCAAAQNADVRLRYKCAADSTSLLGMLVTKTGFTPANAQVYLIEATFEAN